MLCENCHRDEEKGKWYQVHHGLKTDEKDLGSTKVKFFHFISHKDSWICDRCIEDRKRKYGLWALPAVAYWGIMIAYVLLAPSYPAFPGIYGLLIILMLPMIFWGILAIMFISKLDSGEEIGTDLAIDASRKELEAQGRYVFTQAEYKNVRK